MEFSVLFDVIVPILLGLVSGLMPAIFSGFGILFLKIFIGTWYEGWVTRTNSLNMLDIMVFFFLTGHTTFIGCFFLMGWSETFVWWQSVLILLGHLTTPLVHIRREFRKQELKK